MVRLPRVMMIHRGALLPTALTLLALAWLAGSPESPAWLSAVHPEVLPAACSPPTAAAVEGFPCAVPSLHRGHRPPAPTQARRTTPSGSPPALTTLTPSLWSLLCTSAAALLLSTLHRLQPHRGTLPQVETIALVAAADADVEGRGPEYWGADSFYNPATYGGLTPPPPGQDEPADAAYAAADDAGHGTASWRGNHGGIGMAKSWWQQQETRPRPSLTSNEVVLRHLPATATAEQVRDWFATVGVRVVKVELPLDILSLPSGFAVVTLAPGCVSTALTLHRTFFYSSERPIDVDHAQSPLMKAAMKLREIQPVISKEEVDRVVVLTSLPLDVTRQQVVDFLAQAGAEVQEVSMLPESDALRGRAVVHLKEAAMQEMAVTLNGAEIYEGGRWIDMHRPASRIGWDCVAESLGLGSSRPSTDTRVLVVGLPADATEDSLRQFFAARGLRPVHVKFWADRQSGQRAVVTFSRVEDRKRAISASGEYFHTSGRWLRITAYNAPQTARFQREVRDDEGRRVQPGWSPMTGEDADLHVFKGDRIVGKMTMGGKIITPEDLTSPRWDTWKRAKRPVGGTRTLYFANLSWDVDEQVLWAAVEEVTGEGSVTGIRFANDAKTGRFLGYGFVTFRRIHDADEAMEKLQGRGLHRRPVRIDYHTTQEIRQKASQVPLPVHSDDD